MVMPLMPHAGEWTVDDLLDLPDDGLQYELADGILLVTPAPRLRHQRVVGRLFTSLQAAAPPDLEVFVAPVDFQPTRQRSLQPDVLVVRRDGLGEDVVEGGLVLAVEVLSPSTRAKDLVLKRALYEDSGVPSYWVVDPDEPSLLVLELEDGRYVERARVAGDEPAAVALPFPASVVPSALLA